MIFVKSVKFRKDYRKLFFQDDVIDLNRDIVLLVGDQGVGKSSLLSLLRKTNDYLIGKMAPGIKSVGTQSIDLEKDNPRLQGKVETMGQIASVFSSHGEVILAIIKVSEEIKDSLILIDEPESGLSIRSQIRISSLFRKIVTNGNQLVIATHSSVIMNEVGEVYDLKNRKYCSPKEFIESQYAAN